MKSIIPLIILSFFCSANVAGWGCNLLCGTPDGHKHSKPKGFLCRKILFCDAPKTYQTENTDTIELDLNQSNLTSFKWVSKKPNHKWFLSYKYENVRLSTNIGNITFNSERKAKKKTTFLYLTVEAFDNDAEIYCETDESEKSIWRLQFVGKNMTELDILKYNENHNVSPEYLKLCYKSYGYDIFLGVINTTSNQMKMYDMTKEAPPKFDKTHNGSVLCCIFFTSQTSGANGSITRYVEKKTLLVYDVTDLQDSSEEEEEEDAEKRKEVMTSVSTTEDAKGTEAGTRNDDANLDSQNAKPGPVADSNNQYADSSTTLTIYIVSAVAVALILLVIVIIIKRCRKKPKPRAEEPRVLYAELDLLRQHESGNLPKDGPEEESPYAEIIGEIRPR